VETNRKWRLIPLIQGSGQFQMTLDLWLFNQHCQGNLPSILRFYTWDPVAISLGYHQRKYPDFWQNLTWNDQPIDLVRRPTGGRAVLHQGDLSYLMITSDFSGKTAEIYQKLCQFLIAGWRSLGIDLIYGEAGRGYIHNPSCFSTPTNADLLTTEGQKLIGSAQLRRGNSILQHGSMILTPDQTLYQQVFPQEKPLQTSTFFQQQSIPHLVEIFSDAACNCLAIELEEQPLSPWEFEFKYIAKNEIVRTL
jgi:lipoate---protein ligase